MSVMPRVRNPDLEERGGDEGMRVGLRNTSISSKAVTSGEAVIGSQAMGD